MDGCGCQPPTRERLPVTPEEAAGLCAGCAWGDGFTPEEWRTIGWRMHLEQVPAGEEIFRQGDLEAYLAILTQGLVEIARTSLLGRERMLATLFPGSVFGEMSLVDGQPRSATARAVEDSTLLVLPAEGFRRLVDEQPLLGRKLLAHVARLISLRLRQMDGILVEYLG